MTGQGSFVHDQNSKYVQCVSYHNALRWRGQSFLDSMLPGLTLPERLPIDSHDRKLIDRYFSADEFPEAGWTFYYGIHKPYCFEDLSLIVQEYRASMLPRLMFGSHIAHCLNTVNL